MSEFRLPLSSAHALQLIPDLPISRRPTAESNAENSLNGLNCSTAAHYRLVRSFCPHCVAIDSSELVRPELWHHIVAPHCEVTVRIC